MRKHWIGALLVVLAAAFGTPAPADTVSDPARAELARGEERLSAMDYPGAEAQLRSVIQTYPTSEWAWWARVRVSESLLHQGKLEDCILEARKVVNMHPVAAPRVAAAWAQLYVGLSYKAKSEPESARCELEKVRSLLADDPDRGPLLMALCNLSLICHEMNDRQGAIALAKEVLAEPTASELDRARALVSLGSALVGERRLAEGLAELQKVRVLYSHLDEPVSAAERKIFESGYIGCHDYDGAIREARAILSIEGVSERRARQARYYLALALLYQKKPDAALVEAQALLDTYPNPLDDHRLCHTIRARAYAMKKDYARAKDSLEAAMATNPTDTELRATIEWDLATCYRAVGDTARANEHYQRLVDEYPGSHLSLRAAAELDR